MGVRPSARLHTSTPRTYFNHKTELSAKAALSAPTPCATERRAHRISTVIRWQSLRTLSVSSSTMASLRTWPREVSPALCTVVARTSGPQPLRCVDGFFPAHRNAVDDHAATRSLLVLHHPSAPCSPS